LGFGGVSEEFRRIWEVTKLRTLLQNIGSYYMFESNG